MKFEGSVIDASETAALSLRMVHFFGAVWLKLNILKIDSQNIRVNTHCSMPKSLAPFEKVKSTQAHARPGQTESQKGVKQQQSFFSRWEDLSLKNPPSPHV